MFGMSPGEQVRGNWRDPVVIAVAFLSIVLAAGACYRYFAAPVQAPPLEPG